LILETYDGILHKLNIMENYEYEIVDTKDKSLVFMMRNSGREYYISASKASLVDLNLVDRVLRSICVDTRRSTAVFHHILNKE